MLQLGISVSPPKLESWSSSYRRYTELTFRCHVKKAKVMFCLHFECWLNYLILRHKECDKHKELFKLTNRKYQLEKELLQYIAPM